MNNALVVFPLQEELDGFLLAFADERAEYSFHGKIPIVRLPKFGLTLGIGGTGKAQFALQTQYLLGENPSYDTVICAGAAGTLMNFILVGHVVVGVTTIEHDYKNHFNERPRPAFNAAQQLVAPLRKVEVEGFRVHFGTIASGDEDIVDDIRRRELRENTNALAVAWEGAGGARTSRFNKIPFVEVRGITDLAGHSAPEDFLENVQVAMRNVGILIQAFARQKQSE